MTVVGAPNSPRPPRRNNLYLQQRRSLQVTPLCTPINRSGDKGKETEKYASDFDDPASSANRRSISLVAVRDDSEGDDLGKAETEITENEISPSLV